MTFDAYLDQTLSRAASLLGSWAGVHSPTHAEALAGIAVGVIALWMGVIAATRLVAQVSPGAALGLALTWVALVFATDAACRIYAVPPAGQGAAGMAALGLILFAATRALNTSWTRASAVLALSCAFGGLAGALLAMFINLMNAI